MRHIRRPLAGSLVVATCAAAGLAGTSLADAPPVGPLPPGPTSTIQTQKGQLVAFALPRRSGGLVWRVARKYDAGIVRQLSEADVGASVVLVFRVAGSGTTAVTFALTR